MELIRDKHKREGFIGTVIFHIILLIVFIYAGLTYTVPPPEYGMLVNFGTSDTGSGDVQPEKSGDPVITEDVPEPVEEVVESTPETPEPVQEQIVTQEVEDAPEVVEQPKEEKPKEPVEETPPKEVVEEKPKEEEKPKISSKVNNAFSKLKNSKSTSGGSEGDDNNPGDKGQEHGSMDPGAYQGGGGGNGDYFLGGRKANLIKPVDDSQEEGIVIVEIIVDRNGRVLKAFPGAKGSTTTSAKLYKKAKEAALKTKFTPKPDAPLEQKGYIKYNFILG